MAIYVNIPDSAYVGQDVTLGGTLYNFEFTYNSRDERYRLSIHTDEVPVIEGMKLVEQTSPTGKYDLVNFDHGQLYVVRVQETSNQVGRDNIGSNKPYRLLYLTNEEINQL